MSISEGMFTGHWLYVLHVIYLVALLLAVRSAPWRVIAANKGLQHLFLGAAAILAMMWTMRAGISPGLSVHFLGVTALTLILGWDLAIISASFVLLAMMLIGKESWDSWSVNGVCLVVIPALLTAFIQRQVSKRLPKNFFIYLFLCGFLGAAVVVAVSGLLMAILLWFQGVYGWGKIVHEYVSYLPLIMFPEALMNGILMTGIMVFYPDWIRTFDAKAYIDDQ